MVKIKYKIRQEAVNKIQMENMQVLHKNNDTYIDCQFLCLKSSRER